MNLLTDVLTNLAENTAIISAVITGVITFLITRYNWQKNLPTDKFEIAYNRIYYPIIQIINATERCYPETVHKFKTYLDKYRKYANKSTLVAFKQLEKYPRSYYVYENFKRNIKKQESYLRKRLGYLDANIFVMYRYSDQLDKREIKSILGFVITYALLLISNLLVKTVPDANYTEFSMILCSIAFIFMVYEFLSIPIVFLIRKLQTLRSIRNK